HCHKLTAVLSGVGDPSSHDPRPGPLYVKEPGCRLPPLVGPFPQSGLPLSAILCIATHELQAGFSRWEWRGAHIEAEHVDKPQVLADTLVHHMLVDAPPSRIRRIRADRQVFVFEHAPNAYNLYPLGLVSLDEKVVFHSS